MARRDKQIERPGRGLPEGWLFFAAESLVVVAIYVTTLRGDSRLRESLRLVLLTASVITHLILLWLSAVLFQKRPRLVSVYFVVQVVLAFAVGLLTPGYWLAIALYMGLTGMGIAMLWPNVRAVAAAVLLCVALSTYHLVISWGWSKLVQFLPSLGIALSFVVVYVVLFMRQTQARERAQDLLLELETALPSEVIDKVVAHLQGPQPAELDTLSRREGQVLALLAQGATNREVALELNISERTVKAHVTSISNKLGAGSRAEAVSIALRSGLLPAEPPV